jgi:hypothetical protein
LHLNYELEKRIIISNTALKYFFTVLKTGSYLVYFESDSDVKNTKAFAYETITVSNIAVLTSENDKKENYQVLDRKLKTF